MTRRSDTATGKKLIGLLFLAIGCGDPKGDGTNDDAATTTAGTADDAPTGPTNGGPTTNGTTPTTTVGDPDTTVGTDDGSGTGRGSDTDGGSTDDGSVAPPCPYEPVMGNPDFVFEQVGNGFSLSLPTQVVGDPTQPDRLFVVQVFGQIRILEPGETAAPEETFLDLSPEVAAGGERGMLGLAFHPDYPSDPRIYVYYTAQPDGRSRIEEFVIDPETLAPVDANSGTTILEVYQGTSSHHGGMMHFDADDWLVIGFGDGADSTSPLDNGVIHSKFIRIGVEPDGTMDNPLACQGCPQFGPFDYTIPPDNPHVGQAGYAPEIWAAGFRNPWRWYFHPDTGDIFVGDVGNDAWEEVSVVRPGNHYGWSNLEGNNCFDQPGCDTSAGPNQANANGRIAPLVDYDHNPGCAVIGGPIYNSCEVPAWQGLYFYGDLCSFGISALRFENEQLTDLGIVFPANIAPRGSGTNAWGEVFFTGGLFAGEIYKLVPAR